MCFACRCKYALDNPCRCRYCLKGCCRKGCQAPKAFICIDNKYDAISFIENTAELLLHGRKISSDTTVACKLTKKCGRPR